MIEGHYKDWQIKILEETVDHIRDVKDGIIMEIGCWKGKSTAAIANKVAPEILHAVDTWQGNIDEQTVTGKLHPTVREASKTNIFEIFQKNMADHTKGNVLPHKMDCFDYLGELDQKVKFCHIDGSHDYPSVKKTIEMLLPKMAENGILCGDDFKSAHAGREDLQGGVERAVRECLPDFKFIRNFWWWVNESI